MHGNLRCRRERIQSRPRLQAPFVHNVECLTNEDTLANALASIKGRITALQAAADVSQRALVKRLLEAVIGIRTRTSHHRGAQRSRQQLKVLSSPPLSDIRVTPLKPIRQHLICEGE